MRQIAQRFPYLLELEAQGGRSCLLHFHFDCQQVIAYTIVKFLGNAVIAVFQSTDVLFGHFFMHVSEQKLALHFPVFDFFFQLQLF